MAVVGGAVGFVGVVFRDLRNVVREFELVFCEVGGAAVAFGGGPFAIFDGALGDELVGGGDDGADESGDGDEVFHLGWRMCC